VITTTSPLQSRVIIILRIIIKSDFVLKKKEVSESVSLFVNVYLFVVVGREAENSTLVSSLLALMTRQQDS
jgi:hypothetical protein